MNQIVKREPGTVVNWEDETMRLYIKDKYAPKSTDMEFIEFCNVAKMSDANPFLKEIYFIPYEGHPGSIQFSIHWMIKKAHETGVFRGFTLPMYRDKNGTWWDEVWPPEAEGDVPTHCKIGVIRSDHTEPLWGIVSWAERAKYKSEWKADKQRIHMITKCAKAEALRCAVPGLSTVYITDEMHRDDVGGWTHDPERPAGQQMIDAGREAKKRMEFRQGITDPDAEPIKPDKRETIKRLCHGLGHTKVVEYIPFINTILDDHGLPEIPEGKDTKALTVESGEIVLAALWKQMPEEKKEAVTDADLEPEVDETGLFKGDESDANTS